MSIVFGFHESLSYFFSLQHNAGNEKINHPTDIKFFSLERYRGCLAVLTGISICNGKETSPDVVG